MTTLQAMIAERPDLALTFATHASVQKRQQVEVTGLTTTSLPELKDGTILARLQRGSLVLLTDPFPARMSVQTTAAVDNLLQQMALQSCAALVIHRSERAAGSLPQALQDTAARFNIPLLISCAPATRWLGVHDAIRDGRMARAEQRAFQLSRLVEQLPAKLANPAAAQRVTDWLAAALDAQVLVSEPDRVIAAAPASAGTQLAQAVIQQSLNGAGAGRNSAAHTQLIRLAPATGTTAVLAVASQHPFEAGDLLLIRHAAKILGLIDQAHREYRAAAEASQVARSVAVELLMSGERDKAQRIMAALVPEPMDAKMIRVFLIQTTRAARDAALAQCQSALAGRALVAADPDSAQCVLAIRPVPAGADAGDSVADELTQIVAALRPKASLGGSGLYDLSRVHEARQEAKAAQKFAVHQADSVVLRAQDTDLIGLLPQAEGQRWARALLTPLMQQPDPQWQQLRETLHTALAYPYAVAARRLALHRNTITRRVNRAADLLNLDLSTIAARTAVALALELANRRGDFEAADPQAGTAPSLAELLQTPQLKAWADALVLPVRADRRDLLTTGICWLKNDTHVDVTARHLGISEVTLRSHLRALGGRISRDLTTLPGIRDLQFALYLATGTPLIARDTHARTAA
jgi:sugar diacid utilization regulator